MEKEQQRRAKNSEASPWATSGSHVQLVQVGPLDAHTGTNSSVWAFKVPSGTSANSGSSPLSHRFPFAGGSLCDRTLQAKTRAPADGLSRLTASTRKRLLWHQGSEVSSQQEPLLLCSWPPSVRPSVLWRLLRSRSSLQMSKLVLHVCFSIT